MDSTTTLLIINPKAGTDSKRGIEEMVTTRLGFRPEVAYTSGRGSAHILASEAAARGVTTVIAAGGDGTINETAGALLNTSTALGIIPCGSGNGLARHLNIPMDPAGAVDVIASGHIERCDYGTADGSPFFCTFGVGFDAAVSAKFDKAGRRGRLTYLRNTFLEYMSYHPETYTIRAAGKVMTDKAFLVAVCNASQYGNNAYIAPSATIDDGLLDVTIIHAGNTLSTALVGFDMLIGNIERNMLIHTFRTPSLTIKRSNPGAAHLDGEPLQLDDTLEIKCHHRRLKVFAPDSLPPFKPFLTPAAAMLADLKLAVNKLFQK